MKSSQSNVRDAESIVELVDVVAVLGAFPVLAGSSLSVGRGEIVLLRGSNGAGKTSLLKVCAGLLPIERGSGSVLGFDLMHERNLVAARVGYLAHHNGLYADLTVTENVRFWSEMVGARSTDVQRTLSRLSLDGRLADVEVASLSAGQKRRVALACLIARRAELWLLDEPHAGLDAHSRDELDDVLRSAARAGVTVLVASHELDRASALATRQVEVVAGRVVEQP